MGVERSRRGAVGRFGFGDGFRLCPEREPELIIKLNRRDDGHAWITIRRRRTRRGLKFDTKIVGQIEELDFSRLPRLRVVRSGR